MPEMTSPDELLAAGKEMMLEGKEPAGRRDWQILFNFFAANIGAGEVDCCRLLNMIYETGLSEEEVVEIAEFQVSKKS